MNATAQGRLPPVLPDTFTPSGNPTDPYLAYPFQISPEIDKIISSLVADPLIDQTLYAQAMSGDFFNGGLETKLDSVMVSSPSDAELQYYRKFCCQFICLKYLIANWRCTVVMLFFSSFVTQMPMVHSYTWTLGRTPPLLTGAMQACGALYVKNRMANAFITSTLAQARDPLVAQFVRVGGAVFKYTSHLQSHREKKPQP